MEGADRTVTSIPFIHLSFVPSALNRFLTLSVEPGPVGRRWCDCVPSGYCGPETRCGTFVQNYQFNDHLREENVLVYLRLRFRRLSGWIVVAAAAFHEAYLLPRDEYQRHHPPPPSSAGAY